MQDYQKRVVAEREALAEKIVKLVAYVTGATFNNLSFEEQMRMRRQLGIMLAYEEILLERISHFDPSIGASA